MRIYFVGVHGVGKTTTAKYLAYKLKNHTYIDMDCIEDVKGLPPIARQLLFFTTYVRQYLRTYRNKNIIVDSHPLLVIPYTLWWTKNEELADEFLKIILRIPKSDVIVHLKPHNLDILVERIQERYRYNVYEEGQIDYIKFIISKTEEYLKTYGNQVSNHVIHVNADTEVDVRGAHILKELKGILNLNNNID